MSRAFSNQNNKLSSGDLTKREGFRNKYTMINNKPNILLHRSSIYNKRIDYSDYNYIIGQKKIINCLSGNTTNDEIILNTGGEIYLGNGMSLSGDLQIINNICDINDGPLNFFTKHNNYILDNKKFLDYNKSGFCNFDICFGVTINTTSFIKYLQNSHDFTVFSNYFPINQISVIITPDFTPGITISDEIVFTFNITVPLGLSTIITEEYTFTTNQEYSGKNPKELYTLIINDYSAVLIDLKNMTSGLVGLYENGGIEGGKNDTSFNNSTTLPGLRIDTLPEKGRNLNSMLKSSHITKDISGWDVSAITNMESMFQDASCDNIGDIGVWIVKSLQNMSKMFMGSNFNKSLNDWSVNNVQNMSYMFAGTSSQKNPFDKPLNKWNVGKVTNMQGMFLDSSFNNNSIENWTVSNVTNMHNLFPWTNTQMDISNWDISALFTSQSTINSENYPGFYKIFGDFRWSGVNTQEAFLPNYFDGSNNLQSNINDNIWNSWSSQLNEISNNLLINSFDLPKSETGVASFWPWNIYWNGDDWGNKVQKALKITGLKNPYPVIQYSRTVTLWQNNNGSDPNFTTIFQGEVGVSQGLNQALNLTDDDISSGSFSPNYPWITKFSDFTGMYIERLTKGSDTIQFNTINDSKILDCSLNSENYTVWYMKANIFVNVIYNDIPEEVVALDGDFQNYGWTMHLYG